MTTPPDERRRSNHRGRHGAVQQGIQAIEVCLVSIGRDSREWRRQAHLLAGTLRRHACRPHQRRRARQGGGRECFLLPWHGASRRWRGPPREPISRNRSRGVQAVAAAPQGAASEIVTRSETARSTNTESSARTCRKPKKKLGGGGGKRRRRGHLEVNGVKLIGRMVPGTRRRIWKGLVDQGKAKLGSSMVALVSVQRREGAAD